MSLAEVKEHLEKQKEEKDGKITIMIDYIKKFSKLKPAECRKMKEELKGLDILKLRERQIVKIMDLLPEDAEDLHKIFVGEDISLDQNEINRILEVVKKYK